MNEPLKVQVVTLDDNEDT
jgi:hypothetical protein